MVIRVFGKQDCNHCQAARKKLGFFINKWNLTTQVPVQFVDMDTVEGMAEGAFCDVFDVPTTILQDGAQIDESSVSVLTRWESTSPGSSELKYYLKGISRAPTD